MEVISKTAFGKSNSTVPFISPLKWEFVRSLCCRTQLPDKLRAANTVGPHFKGSKNERNPLITGCAKKLAKFRKGHSKLFFIGPF